ncbi:AtpZ/AtpI family protein [uncultured Kordia sp.]|uniref:AtpZ/AtpI family protein n=1 Tax=uncultured Kordia sp. TaxID=507699 RepID=UPI002633C24F|nr:AtpZ/AtpI family protein [uncultured Kordia sp.]
MTKKKPIKPLKSYVKFTGIAFQMAVVIGLGVYLGMWLDEKYPNKHQLFTVVCSLVFVSLSMWQVIRQLKKFNKD